MRSIFLAVLAMFLFASTYAFFKSITEYIPNTVAIFFQSLFSFGLLLPFLSHKRTADLFKPGAFLVSLRAFFGLAAFYLITKAFYFADLSEVVLLNNVSPLLVPILASVFFQEKIEHKLWPALIVGFGGVLVILRPGFREINLGLILALGSALASALVLLTTKKIAHRPFFTVLFYYFCTMWIILFPSVFTKWNTSPLYIWLYILMASISMLVAQVAFTAALRGSSSQIIAPFLYMTVLFSGIFDWIFWGIKPDPLSIFGMLIVCIGGIYSMVVSNRKKQA